MDETRIAIKVVPGASRDGIAGMLGDRLKVRVSAPPEGGRANRAVCKTIGAALGIKARQVEIVAGHASAEKTVAVRGVPADEVRRRLGLP